MPQVFYTPQFQALSIAGAPLSGAKLHFFKNGTTVAADVYADAARSTTLSNPVVADAQGRFPQIYSHPDQVYRVRLTDSANVQQWQEDGVSVQLFARTEAERAAAVTPVNYSYPPGDVRRYGADPTGTTDSKDAFQSATNTGEPVLIPEGTFLISGQVTRTGRTVWIGKGRGSILRSDSTILSVTNGTGSHVTNLYFENVNAPWIIKRDEGNWTAPPVLKKSNDPGYPPTDNDQDIWSSLSSEQRQEAGFGSTLFFQGNATGILVENIYGRFVNIALYDAQYSCVRNCDFRAGKSLGGIVFWNVNAQEGRGNRAISNRVIYAAYNGILFSRNFDFLAQGNTVEYCGESGIKTWQGELPPGQDARCYNGTTIGNKIRHAYYDGIDHASNYPLNDAISCSHTIVGNETFNCFGDGLNIDGRHNCVVGNKFWNSGRFGIWGYCAESLISSNVLLSNGLTDPNTYPGIIMAGSDGRNNIVGNHVQFGAGFALTGIGILSGGTLGNFIAHNYVFGQNITTKDADVHSHNYVAGKPYASMIHAQNSAPVDSELKHGHLSFWLDETTNALKVRVRYSNGVYKTGTIALT